MSPKLAVQVGAGEQIARVVGLGEEEEREDNCLSNSVRMMEPLMRFLQLLCENHNLDLQQYLRDQNNKTNYDLVSETLRFLDCICGSTTGVLGLLGLYINKNNVELIKQALETLTEYCQGSGKIQTPVFIKNIFSKRNFFLFLPQKGPCVGNQYAIAMHESNGLDIVTAIVVDDMESLKARIKKFFLRLSKYGL